MKSMEKGSRLEEPSRSGAALAGLIPFGNPAFPRGIALAAPKLRSSERRAQKNFDVQSVENGNCPA